MVAVALPIGGIVTAVSLSVIVGVILSVLLGVGGMITLITHGKLIAIVIGAIVGLFLLAKLFR